MNLSTKIIFEVDDTDLLISDTQYYSFSENRSKSQFTCNYFFGIFTNQVSLLFFEVADSEFAVSASTGFYRFPRKYRIYREIPHNYGFPHNSDYSFPKSRRKIELTRICGKI